MVARLVLQMQSLPLVPDAGPRRSDIVSYDNISTVIVNTDWNYKGGPQNSTAGWNTDWRNTHIRYAGTRADKMRLEWSYTTTEALSLNASMRPAYMSGTVNGYITAIVPEPYGTRTLYGARALTRGTTNAGTDVTAPEELARLLGPAPGGSTLKPHMRGVEDWASQGFTAILHDEVFGHSNAQYSYGALSFTASEGFTGHGSAVNYTTYLRGLYANDAAYAVARDAGTVPGYQAYTVHLAKQALDYLGNKSRAKARTFGMQFGINCFQALPTEHPGTSYVALMYADYAVSELLPTGYFLSADKTLARSDRLAGESFTIAARWQGYFAAISLHLSAFRGYGRRGAYALQPPVDWMPAPTVADGPPPTTAWAVPPKVKAAQRLGFAWVVALGASPVLPLGVFDLALQEPAFTKYTGYTGSNRTLWSGPVDDYKDLFQWIANSAAILDDYEDAPSILVAEPFTSNWWGPSGVAAASTGRYYQRVVGLCLPLTLARVPFVFAPVGGQLSQLPQSRYQFANAMRVVKPTADIEYTDNASTVPVGANVVDQATLLAGDLTQFAPVSVTGERDTNYPLLVNARVRKTGSAMTLHCINTDACDFATGAAHHDSGAPAGVYRSARSGLVVTLKPWAWLANKRPVVTWHSPEAAIQGQPIATSVTDAGLSIKLPALLEYGVIHLDFS